MTYDEKYWTSRYKDESTPWDVGQITTPLKEYFDQLDDKSLKILIPGCGNAYEAAYLHSQGFINVYLVDISEEPIIRFKANHPDFPPDHIIYGDFFELEDSYDLIIEQTFFCALHPSQRHAYAIKTNELLVAGGKLVGLLFNDSLNSDRPPFGGFKEDYIKILGPHFELTVIDESYNSIPPRKGRELFINLKKIESN
ncbi:methyltransferase domain-containing protein [Fulvivirga lutimaris]|uniref:methyltransferase domain-containing protein n=1 Tax=Fulvivirga lutimaris TaxID=1819566 RepID=UPI0012BD23BA|nr:methyltransferase domain-containing protein [Fulvivirga lutimaris]MTI38171.1 methyltransferase domain-containing protein [Fulvivirga lutimaris]